VSLNVSLKEASRLLVLVRTTAEKSVYSTPGQTELSIDVGLDRSWSHGDQYPLPKSGITPSLYEIVPARVARPGRHKISLSVFLSSASGPPRTVRFSDSQITVIALPGLS
jgi:hypothetical protein